MPEDEQRELADDVKRYAEMIKRSRWRNRVNRGSGREAGTPRGSAPQGGTQENVIHLPRGGVYVRTKHGSIQFGMPPETIKDSLNLGLEVPAIFVPPKDRFNLKYGTNCCEVEFPAYWNFFVKVMARVRANPNPNPNPSPSPSPNQVGGEATDGFLCPPKKVS